MKRSSKHTNAGRGKVRSELSRLRPELERARKELMTCRRKLRQAQGEGELEVARHTRDLEAEIEHLKDLSRSKDEFIRITNHELRTPLDVIRGNLDMVLKGESGALSPQTREYLSDVLLGADRLTKLVNDMLDISRIETGRMKFELQEVNIVAVIKTIVTEFQSLTKEKHLTLYVKVPETLPQVFSDRSRIFQIIDNLLGNALKFTPSGGAITVRASTEEESVVISVQDTGIGIRTEDTSKLFRRFPEIDTSAIGTPKGTGLGLYLVWQLVEKLGGEVWVESRGLGQGATFSFRLPRHDSKRAKELARFHAVFLTSGG